MGVTWVWPITMIKVNDFDLKIFNGHGIIIHRLMS